VILSHRARDLTRAHRSRPATISIDSNPSKSPRNRRDTSKPLEALGRSTPPPFSLSVSSHRRPTNGLTVTSKFRHSTPTRRLESTNTSASRK
jgi:hypothetical protein